MKSSRNARGFIFLMVSAVLAAIILVSPMPYAIEMPGPSWNTLGTSTITNKDGTKTKVPLIAVEGAPTYPTSGALDLLTVSVAGNPEHHPLFGDVVMSWLNPERAVVPMDLIYPPDVSQADQDKENAAAMVDSQREAIAAAFTNLGYDVSDVRIDKVQKGSPAEGKLQAGDIVESVNGKVVMSITDMRAALKTNGTNKPASFVYLRDKIRHQVDITPVLSDPDAQGRQFPAIKVLGSAVYDFPFKVTIRLDDVGGPSAGMMFALGVLDVLTPDSLTGGRKIAGTGTIDSAGEVGPIGGIRQKMYSARTAGASYMFVPADNCAEAFGHVPEGIQIFKVSTLNDALKAAKVIAKVDSSERTAELAKLPTCTK
ncbi:MAG: Lon protease 1 [Actinomycetota bacterium]|jgi:PDZ domain-containing protein